MAKDQFGNYVAGQESAGKTIATYDYAGSPVGNIVPTADYAVCVDTVTGNRWEWGGGAWSQVAAQTDAIPASPTYPDHVPATSPT